jgi:VWFA-related protein
MGARVLFGAAAIALSSFPVSALQDPALPAKGSPPLVIRVGVDLIQIDAAVTDNEGRPITDLRAEDFSIEIDGKKQPVSNAMFFEGRAGMAASAGSSTSPAAGPASPDRTLVFIVDDLNISFDSMYKAKLAMQKFAASWDFKEARVGLRSTSEDAQSVVLSRSPERFDKSLQKLRYSIRSSKGASSTPVEMRAGPEAGPASGYPVAWTSSPSVDLHAGWTGNPAMERSNFEQRVYSLLSTINALRSIPGRKAVVLVSEGFSLGRDRDQLGIASPFDSLFADHNEVDSVLRMIVEVANRASVVIYTIDPSGLLPSGPGADVAFAPSLNARRDAWFERVGTQGTLQRLAEDTGGLSVYNRNDLKRGLVEVVNDQRAYYLIGFEPPKAAFDKKSSGKPKFHEIKLRVNRPDVQVRTRAGFYGVTDDDVVQRVPLMALPQD